MHTREIDLKAINRSETYRYMGFKGSEPDDVIKALIDDGEKALLKAMKPRFVYKCFDIEACDEGVKLIGTNLTLKGESIKKHLSECNRAVVMCATLSSDVDKLIRQNEVGNIFGAMVTDALANAAIEQVCDAAELFISVDFPGYNRTWRFGVGYGDFPLSTQKDFLNVLDAQKTVGVCANDNSILIPRKSVTCVIGLSEKEVEQTSSCSTCNFRDKCAISKEGGSCGGK